MRRRTLIGLALVGVAPGLGAFRPLSTLAIAQQSARVARVGWIWGGRSAGNPIEVAGFRQGLKEFGYIEGQNIIVEFRTAAGKYEDLPRLATELVALNPDVIFAPAEAALRACLRVSHTIPIVMAAVEFDPVEVGLITSIARPGGNVTGVIFNQVQR